MRFVDCQGLAGAWTLGTVQAGFELAHRASLPGGFGDEAIDANRKLVGDGWTQEVGLPGDGWTPQEDVAYLCGTPPCSGFSLLNSAKGENSRGPGSTINNCMKELIAYASTCRGTDGKQGPEVVAFESVQQAYSQGRELMLWLRDDLAQRTGQPYAITHVLMSGASIGAAQFRHRYYPVFHRIPFGVDPPQASDLPDGHVTTYSDAIGDLVGGELTWDRQAYPHAASSAFQRRARLHARGFDAHVTLDHGRTVGVLREVWEAGWDCGETLPEALIRNGLRPPALERSWTEDLGNGKPGYKGWSWPIKIRPDRCGYVLTGGGIHGFVHFAEPRLLTVRECSRLMGYPDTWHWPTGSPNQASMWIGKCCPVNSGRWISTWVKRALKSNPGEAGAEHSTGEYYFNCTNDYKRWPGGAVPKRSE